MIPILEAELGAPECDVSGEPLDELIATILSQNTSDTNSRRAWESLRARFPSWRAVRDARRDALVEAIASGGLAETKARTIQEVLSALDTEDGEPSLDAIHAMTDDEAIAWLTSFRGVGVKTAACVLLFALGRNVCPVDTHVHRVANRLGLVSTRARDRTFTELHPLIPDGLAYRAHVLFVRFGRRICTARNPRCHRCPLYDECAFEARHEMAASWSARERERAAG